MRDKMREEFEAWIDANEIFHDLFGEEYELMWQAWQASRAALVVKLPITVCRTHVFELPHTHEVGMEHDEYFEVDDIKKSLDAAGVAYK